MKLETLKTFKLKKLIIPIVIVLCLIIVVTTFTSKSKYVYVDSITIMEGTVNYTPYPYKIIKQYKQKDTCEDTSQDNCYEETSEAPTSGYVLNVDKTYYYLDYEEQKVYKEITQDADGTINYSQLPMRSKCFLYFDKKGEDLGKKTYEQLLAKNKDLQSKGSLPETFTSGCDTSSCSGVYEAPDDDGTSYYFRGVVENNYVKFGNMGTSGSSIWWRIIRINGDGTIRMIFAGTGGTAPNQTGLGTMINNGATYKFNNSSDRAEYVGFEYQLGIRNGNSGGNKNQKSNALQTLESWFATNLVDELEAGYIDENAGFCADRTAYEYNGSNNRNDNLGTGTQMAMYGGYMRTINRYRPTLKCEDKDHDLFTSINSKQGTQSLEYPIGLTTIDEQVYAGNHWLQGRQERYYLYNGQFYWTISPDLFNGTYAAMFGVSEEGRLNTEGTKYVSESGGLRPVLNIRIDALEHGGGTASSPFRSECEFGGNLCNVETSPT